MDRYGRLVVQALDSLPSEKRPNVSFLSLSPPQRHLALLPPRFHNWWHHLWIAGTAPGRVRALNPDLCHVLDGSHAYLVSRLRPWPSVVTAHDLIPFLCQRGEIAGQTPSRTGRWLIQQSLRGLRQARHIMAVSDATRRDVLRLANVPAAKTSVVYNALYDSFQTDKCERLFENSSPPPGAGFGVPPSGGSRSALPEDKTSIRRFQTDQQRLEGGSLPIILHVGHNAAYKNRDGVLRTFAQVCQTHDCRLVMAGPAPTCGLRTLAAELGMSKKVEWLTEPDDHTLGTLYHQAALLLFPSRYEGFGWPPLEAMAAGCPVVVSNAASLPEVVGNAALMAPPENHAQLARHCCELLSNARLAQEMVRRGLERVQEFTLPRMAAGLMAAYASALAAPGQSARGRASTDH